MKKAHSRKPRRKPDELEPDYRFNYKLAKPNRFAQRFEAGVVVVPLDSDVAKVFTTPEAVNKALRALIEVMPKASRSA